MSIEAVFLLVLIIGLACSGPCVVMTRADIDAEIERQREPTQAEREARAKWLADQQRPWRSQEEVDAQLARRPIRFE